jgi:hypothetical protein
MLKWRYTYRGKRRLKLFYMEDDNMLFWATHVVDTWCKDQLKTIGHCSMKNHCELYKQCDTFCKSLDVFYNAICIRRREDVNADDKSN